MVTIDHKDRDERVLNHIGRYRIAFRQTLSCLFFDGRSPGNVLQRLLSNGRIVARASLPERVSYYQLSLSEVRRRGLPEVRSRPFPPQAFHSHLAALWFCCMNAGSPERRRLESAELARLFDGKPPKGPHCLEGGQSPRVYRIHALGPDASARGVVRALRQRIERFREHTRLGPWLRNRQYVFALLADSPPRADRLWEALNDHRVLDRAEVAVGHAPNIRTIAAALRGLAAPV